MRKKTHSKIRDNYIVILFTLFILLFFNIIISNFATAQDEQPKLVVTLDKHTFKANEPFSVTVTDENGNLIEGATVGIQSYGGLAETEGGLAQLVAPEGKDEIIKITIKAQKEGYIAGTTTAWVNSEPSILDLLIQNPYFPITIAALLLILAIGVVNWRQKKSINVRAKDISKEQTLKRYRPIGKIVLSPSSEITGETVNQNGLKRDDNIELKQEPKVEEIRISRPRKDKKIISVKTEKEEPRKRIPRKTYKKHDYDWFEGTDDIRYEIDRITGEIDEERLDKWFEGIDDIRAKIDEKLKKKDKEKDK